MTLADTSVLVAAFATWHERHDAAAGALAQVQDLIGHTAFEFVSTLSRLPDPHRVRASDAHDYLRRRFGGRWFGLDGDGQQSALARAVGTGIAGGSLFDALIGATALELGRPLLSLDRRAEATYRAVGVEVVFV